MYQTKYIYLFLLIIFFSWSCQKENAVPVANAGASQTITLPINSVTVNGIGADADGQVVGYLWSKLSGPASPTIVNPASAATVISGLSQGSYVFQFMVTDNKGATGVDTMSVQVNPSPIQTTTFQPSNNPFEWTMWLTNGVEQDATNRPDIPIEAWTVNSNPTYAREVIKFDLSSIPASASIQSATLYLYSYPSPTQNGNLVDANSGTNNTMLIQQVSSNWNSSSINFNLTATTANQVIVPSTTQSILDLNVDVTALVSSMVNTNSNYGFLLKLQNETIYNIRNFVSSYNTTHTTKYPKLVVTYQ